VVTISRGNKCSVWCPSGAGAPAARPRDGLRTAAQVSLNLALVKNATLHGVFWGSYMQHQPRVLRASLEELLGWLGAGRISVPIFHRRAQPCITLTLHPICWAALPHQHSRMCGVPPLARERGLGTLTHEVLASLWRSATRIEGEAPSACAESHCHSAHNAVCHAVHAVRSQHTKARRWGARA